MRCGHGSSVVRDYLNGGHVVVALEGETGVVAWTRTVLCENVVDTVPAKGTDRC